MILVLLLQECRSSTYVLQVISAINHSHITYIWTSVLTTAYALISKSVHRIKWSCLFRRHGLNHLIYYFYDDFMTFFVILSFRGRDLNGGTEIQKSLRFQKNILICVWKIKENVHNGRIFMFGGTILYKYSQLSLG